MATIGIGNLPRGGRPATWRAIAIGLAFVAASSAVLAAWLQIAKPSIQTSSTPATAPAAHAQPRLESGQVMDRLVAKAVATASAHPQDPEAQAQLGFAYLQAARETGDPSAYGSADAAFAAGIRLDPTSVDNVLGQGSLALSRHQFAHALDLGKQAAALDAFISRSYGIIADAQIELGQYDKAQATVQHMVDLRPDLASYSRVSYLRELNGDLPGAIQAMELAVSAAGPATENTEYVRVQLGNLYFASGRLDDAQATYEQSLLALPNYRFALAGLARVEAARGHLDSAISLYRRSVASLPLPELVISLGEALESAGQTDAAADQYALVEAMQQLFAANGVRTDLEMAAFYADHGDAATAVALGEAAYRERPSIFGADALAWALHKAGRDQEALPLTREALRLGTKNSRLLYHAGIIEAALGLTDAARAHLHAALALNPAWSPLDAPRAAAALRKLGS
jgi:tetratricopeptide (TPR) repeat protein